MIDAEDIRQVIQGCLEDIAGWEVMMAESGQEGLVKAIAEKPDAIVLDLMIPGIDGLTFLKELRTCRDMQATPVVLLTAKVSLTYP